MRKTTTILNICLALALLFASINVQAQIKVANGGKVTIGNGTGDNNFAMSVVGSTFFSGPNLEFRSPGAVALRIYAATFDNAYSKDPVITPQLSNYGVIGGDMTPFYKIYSSSFQAGFGGFRITCDERAKTNIKKISIQKENTTNKLQKLNVYQYDYIENLYDNMLEPLNEKAETTEKNELKENAEITEGMRKHIQDRRQKLIDEGKNQTGVMAQELKEIYPELVSQSEVTGLYSINYIGLIPHLILAIQEQNKELANKSQEIETLKNEMAFMQVNCCNNFTIDPKPIKDIKTKSYIQNSEGQTTITNNNIVARLDQNIPNPFSENTQISCFIPEQSKQVQLCVYDLTGKQLKQYAISQKGEISVTIQGQELQAGIYLYALLIDGQLVDSKKMVLTK